MTGGLTISDSSATHTVVLPLDANESRLPVGSVARDLFDNPWKFDFFEAVLILQELATDSDTLACESIGGFAQPGLESLRFTVPNSQAFPTSSIQSIHWDTETQRPQVHINFMGLTGPSGTMPRSYTSRLQQIAIGSRHSERYALRDWLDNFNHRMISLFFDAWTKYRFPISIRQQLAQPKHQKRQPTLIHVALSAIAGLESQPANIGFRQHVGKLWDANRPLESTITSSDQELRAKLDRDELLGLAGILSQRPMNVSNLQSAAQRCLGVPIRVQQFDGCWLNLEDDSQSRLGQDNCKLGHDALLGERIWTRQQKIRIEVGPLTQTEFDSFLPPSESGNGEGYRRLCELVRTCVGPSLDFDVQPILKIERPLSVQLSADSSVTRLGIDSWLGAPTDQATANDAIFSGV